MTPVSPIRPGAFVLSSPFGARNNPVTGAQEGHLGADFAAPLGTPFYAAADGVVVEGADRANVSGFGRWVWIDCQESAGLDLIYGHGDPAVRAGDRVRAGDLVGTVNTHGQSTGPHLHFETWTAPGRLGGHAVDPLPWLNSAAESGEENMPEDTPATVFGIDVSNHQGNFDFAGAAAEGFRFATHKITEGTWRDPYWPRARTEMARHFPGRWGGYVFSKVGTDPDAEADALLDYAGGPDFPLQIDYEDLDNAGNLDDLNARITAYTARGFRLLPIYLPRWYWMTRMGSPDLSRLPVPIWNSDYIGSGGYASVLYPGDLYKGWAPMGGKDIAILQFTEGAAVAGQRIDANAIRGGETQLAELFGGKDDDMTPEQERKLNAVYDELTKKFPSRSKYRKDNKPVDTLAGMVLNVDGRAHELSIDAPEALAEIKTMLDELPAKIAAAIKGATNG